MPGRRPALPPSPRVLADGHRARQAWDRDVGFGQIKVNQGEIFILWPNIEDEHEDEEDDALSLLCGVARGVLLKIRG